MPIFPLRQSAPCRSCWPAVRRVSLRWQLFYDLYIETHGAETVITANHGAIRIFHPSVKEVAFAACQRLDKLPDAFPGFRTEAFGTLSVYAKPRLSLAHLAGVGNGVFVLRHEVSVLHLPYGSYLHGFHSRGNVDGKFKSGEVKEKKSRLVIV